MIGKGSTKHNCRAFHAANTDPERTYLNRSYCNDDIQEVYRDLFSEALERYNEKQTRSDRVIADYYEKIRSGKQEKPFHEIILQIGNCDDMNSKTENGELAAKVLDEYIELFQFRNPNLRVFSVHLHMDEATPHLHIDFVPFITRSKRGLDTRVSLKQALAAQGFKGGTKEETEWNQWVNSEKNQLASVMERHGIEWQRKGTHEKHLSVLDYEKKMRSEEVAELETKIEDLQVAAQDTKKFAEEIQEKLDRLQYHKSVVDLNARKFDIEAEWQLPEPTVLMSASSYKTKVVEPFIKKLKDIIKSLVSQCLELRSSVNNLSSRLYRVSADNEKLMERIKEVKRDNRTLTEIAEDYRRIKNTLGAEQLDSILDMAQAAEQAQRQYVRLKKSGRER